jgi:hypothetical protein
VSRRINLQEFFPYENAAFPHRRRSRERADLAPPSILPQPALYRHISAGVEFELGLMAEQGQPDHDTTVFFAVIFALWALYAFSGAGLTSQLPLLRAALIAICAIYLLRALALLPEIDMLAHQGYPFRFVVFSSVSLLAGLLYLIGLVTHRAVWA